MSNPSSPLTFTIRYASKDDITAITKLEQVSFPIPYTEKAIEDLFNPSYLRVFVAVSDDGTLLGYLCGTSLPPEGDLLRVAVFSKYRRLGIARCLVKTFLDTLASEGGTVCFLDVRSSNIPAQSLYTSFGFSVCGRRRDYYRSPTEDALEMKCTLSAKEATAGQGDATVGIVSQK